MPISLSPVWGTETEEDRAADKHKASHAVLFSKNSTAWEALLFNRIMGNKKCANGFLKKICGKQEKSKDFIPRSRTIL